MASHQNPFTSEPGSASAPTYSFFDDPNFYAPYPDFPSQAPPNNSVKHISPSGQTGDGLQNDAVISLQEKIVDILLDQGKATHSREQKQDEVTTKLMRALNWISGEGKEARREIAELKQQYAILLERMIETNEQMIKIAKQAENSRLKYLIKESITQVVPPFVHQAVSRIAMADSMQT